MRSTFVTFTDFPLLPVNPSLLLFPRQPPIYFLSLLMSLHILEFYINGISQYVLSHVAFLPNKPFLRFIRVIAYINSSFCLLLSNIPYMNVLQVVYSLVDECLGFFQLLAITNKAAMNIHVDFFIWR
uniref:Uncharacterized protein n=1 Tax=Rousettus aegyptiacus TaxID=9407 RepID=A0A7J8GA76_ROUAE|nr:hypothetical protein HJG63_011494 [Rousettus aegyptiacus]